MSLKAAPRRDVVDVVREGDWGDVTYRHRLSCGHTEVRKRPARAKQMACESCLLAKHYKPEAAPLSPVGAVVHVDEDLVDPVAAEIAFVEGEAGRLRAGLARRFDVSLDSVDVVLGDVDGRLQVVSGMVFLDAGAVRRLGVVERKD